MILPVQKPAMFPYQNEIHFIVQACMGTYNQVLYMHGAFNSHVNYVVCLSGVHFVDMTEAIAMEPVFAIYDSV